MLFQCVQYRCSVSVFIAGVESEVEDFFIGILCIVCVVSGELFDRSIAVRPFLRFRETSIPSSLQQMQRRLQRGRGIGTFILLSARHLLLPESSSGSDKICGCKKK